KLAAPNTAVYLAVFPKGTTAPAAPAKGNNKNAGPMPVFERFDFDTVGADGKLGRYVQVKPGDYDVYLVLKDKGTVEKIDKNYTPRVGVMKKELTVPDYTKTELSTS